MSNYNPYTAAERHRRARQPKEMSAKEFVGCVGIGVLLMLAMFAAALI